MGGTVLLFGSHGIEQLNTTELSVIQSLTNQQCTILIGDGSGVEQKFNETLSRLGYRDNTLVFGAEGIKNNKYKHNELELKVKLNSSSSEIEVRDKANNLLYVIKDINSQEEFKHTARYNIGIIKAALKYCDAAVCIWDGKSKKEQSIINYMSIINKPCYVYKHDV